MSIERFFDDDQDGVSRRIFLKAIGISAAVVAANMMAPYSRGATTTSYPIRRPNFDAIVPSDKNLQAEWVRSLFDRGTRTIYRGADELKWIGMPVGGVTTGTVYLGGTGNLWAWEVFNKTQIVYPAGDQEYSHQRVPASKLAQGFAIRTSMADSTDAPVMRTFDQKGFPQKEGITFCGEYPIGYVEYRDKDCPVEISLEAFSPFIPLNAEESSLPATVMRYTLKNTTAQKVKVELGGWLENKIADFAGALQPFVKRVNRAKADLTYGAILECGVELPAKPAAEDLPVEDFDKLTYEGWETEGTAFGNGPMLKAHLWRPEYELPGKSKYVVHSLATAPGKSDKEKYTAIGTLTSKPFTVQRRYLQFWVGGGARQTGTSFSLLLDEKPVLSLDAVPAGPLRINLFDMKDLLGKQVRIRITDSSPDNFIIVGEIFQTDQPGWAQLPDQCDVGTMALALLNTGQTPHNVVVVDDFKTNPPNDFVTEASKRFKAESWGALVNSFSLNAGESLVVSFALTWNFPNLPLKEGGRNYANRFTSAEDVAKYIGVNDQSLYEQTKLWHDTWYDSSLPYWFLDRTFLNISTLATGTAYRFKSGRFWAFEGCAQEAGYCDGTCTHVWYYAQSMSRIFPELERNCRERTDFGTAIDKTGTINFRGDHDGFAADGQCGCVLRAYREHRMSADAGWLRKIWPNVKLAMQRLIQQDNGNGLLEGKQPNTLDASWFGNIAWISGLYQAALRASAEMATEMDDADFARECAARADKGRDAIVNELFDGEYFINKIDPAHADVVNSGTGCYVDQVGGQAWAFQAGLGRVLPEQQTRTALKSLWKYNFSPDVGPYRKLYKPGRWYAMPGETGLLMCSFPRTDWDYEQASGKNHFAMYFNECWNGLEHQVAGHMIWEGMVQEGLAIERALHDRYHASKRNPWNEIECGAHYARSMSSHGVFIAACGYEYHGPKGHISFAPRIKPEDFKAAFTVAEGWGAFSQKRDGDRQTENIEVKWGRLRLKSMTFAKHTGPAPTRVAVKLIRDNAENPIADGKIDIVDGQVTIHFADEIILEPKQLLTVTIS